MLAPELLETTEIDQLQFHGLSNGRVVTGFEIAITDVETTSLELVEASIRYFLKSLGTDAICRIWLASDVSFQNDGEHSRKEAISSLGFVQNKLTIFFECQSSSQKKVISYFKSLSNISTSLEKTALALKSAFDITAIKAIGVSTRTLSKSEIESYLIHSLGVTVDELSYGVDLGRCIVGVIRLVRQSAMGVNVLTLANLKDALPLPYEIRVSVRRMSSEASEGFLRRKTNQAGSGTDKVAASKFLDAQDQLEDVALFGGSLFQVEFLVLLPRDSERSVRQDADQVVQRLKPLGDFAFETFGSGRSFLAAQIGFDQHVSLLEGDAALPSYLPIWSAGRSPKFSDESSARALCVHRRDQSLAAVDLFHPSYDNFSACIFGKSGRGKSVLTNLLTRALHFDSNVQIIKIDVGGSHSKETRLLGGEERCLSLSEPSGINPFEAFRTSEHSEDVCNVVAGFLNVLLLEEGEIVLSKAMRGDIERSVAKYSESRPRNPTLNDFFSFATDIPRRDLLSRWTENGIYRNAFRSVENRVEKKNVRLRYFNFSQIFQANDPDFGQGGLASVMAQFNLDLMASKGKKLVFIADETPFFIERCFSFFKFSTANVRKFGGSFITVAQKSSDVVVNGDPGIIENSSMKFLFSIDGEREAFIRRLKLENKDVDAIESLQSIKGAFSEALFCDAYGSRVLRIQLTKDEHWRVTSSQDDNEKLKSLMAAVPGLSIEEAIRCLSH